MKQDQTIDAHGRRINANVQRIYYVGKQAYGHALGWIVREIKPGLWQVIC